MVSADENTVTVQDYLPKTSQQSYDSTLFTTILGLTILGWAWSILLSPFTMHNLEFKKRGQKEKCFSMTLVVEIWYCTCAQAEIQILILPDLPLHKYVEDCLT